METDNTSGYSSIATSPQNSDDDLLKSCKWGKTRLELKPRDPMKDAGPSEKETKEEKKVTEELEDGEQKYQPVITPNEIEPHKEWYHKLIMFKLEFSSEKRAAFPPFPPPPLPSAMIAASRAVSVNSFEEAKLAASNVSSASPASNALEKREHRFRPADFQPLPPPHVYLEMIRTLAPHQYIDLTYALAGAVLLDLGFRIPEYYPPLPPKIEPFRDLEAEERAQMTEASSQSSSEGEYSDASENSRTADKIKRKYNRERRAAREIRIAAKMLSTMGSLKEESEEKPKKETFSRDSIYKEKTLAKFIPRRIHHRLPIPSFLPPPFPSNNRRPPIFVPYPPPFPMDHPMWIPLPIPLLTPPETPSTSKDHHNQMENSTNQQLQLRKKSF